MSNPVGAMNLSGMLLRAGNAAWDYLPPRQDSSRHTPLQLPDQTGIVHLPLPVLELDVLHASLGLSTRTMDTSVRQYDSKQHLYSVISTLALAIKAKDTQLYRHSRRVQSLANSLMQAINFPKDERMAVGLAALFHDIGKICIEDALLHKAESLTSQEFEVIKEHPAHGALILGHFGMPKNVIPMVYHHHERWDGNGYPAGLQGEAIPLGARIVAIADAFEVMTSHRAYQATRTTVEALEELYVCAGTQFDSYLVEWFSTLVADKSGWAPPDEVRSLL
jgi:putative two-component system response regulator